MNAMPDVVKNAFILFETIVNTEQNNSQVQYYLPWYHFVSKSVYTSFLVFFLFYTA